MAYSDPGQIVAAVVLFIVCAWLVVKAGQWAIQATCRVALAAKQEAEEMPGKLNSRLNSPVKRLGACIAAAGLLSVAIGVFQIALDASYFEDAVHYFFISATWLITDHPYRVFKAVAYGVPMTLIGLAFSFFYDAGVGKIIGWILHGRRHPTERRA